MAVDTNTLVSGLLFPGPERRLLIRAVAGRVDLVVSDYVADETLRVLVERFADHPAIEEALAWLERLLLLFERMAKAEYEGRVDELSRVLRDPKDAPVLAGALAAEVDVLVSGDKDLLVLKEYSGLPVRRTRQVLKELEG